MRKVVIFIIATMLTCSAAMAQSYNWGVGGRFAGETIGLSVKHHLNASNALEAILAMPYKDGFVVTALYERHVPVIENGFHFFYGAGAHVGSWNHKFSLGADVIIGLEYKIPNVPIAISLDYKPVFNIVSRTKFYMLDFGLGVRVTF